MNARSTLPTLALLGTLAVAACSNSTPAPAALAATPTPSADRAAPSDTDAELRARGEYLVKVAGCNDCHTPGWDDRKGEVPVAEWLVGVPMGFTGPWGTTFASNLRLRASEMDEAAWLEFTRTLTTRPVMPYYNVRAMTEEDRRALYRFIRSLGPAGVKAPDYLPPGQHPEGPRFELVLPDGAGNPAG